MTLSARPVAIASPSRIFAAIGCSSAATSGEILALVERCLAELGANANQLVALGSHVRKIDHPGLVAAARTLDLPLCLLHDQQLDQASATPSERVFQTIGIPSVAEAVAAAAGVLMLGRRASAHVTCAIARVGPAFDPWLFGQPWSASASIASSSVSTSTAGP